MPRGNKRSIMNSRFANKQLNYEHKKKKEISNPFKTDNISDTSGDSISLSEKPSTSKQTVQYPTRTFENRSTLEAFQSGVWKKPDKEHDAGGNAKKKPQRKQGKRTYINFHAFNYSDPEDYADADSYLNGPAMRYVDVARSALYSRSSPTPVQKIQQRAPNLDLQEFPYLKPNKFKYSEPQIEEINSNEIFENEQEEFHEIIEDSEIEKEVVKNNVELNGSNKLGETVELETESPLPLIAEPSLNEHKQFENNDAQEENEELLHPLAFQTLSPYPSSSFVYINPNMENNFDYIERDCPLPPPLSDVCCNKSSLIEQLGVLENDVETESSCFSYGAGDAGEDQDSSDTSTIQHSETTSEYVDESTSDEGQSEGFHIFTFEWLEMTIKHLTGPFDVVIPNFNYFDSHIDFPRFARQFEDTNYLRLEQRAMFGLRLAEHKHVFKGGPYI